MNAKAGFSRNNVVVATVRDVMLHVKGVISIHAPVENVYAYLSARRSGRSTRI